MDASLWQRPKMGRNPQSFPRRTTPHDRRSRTLPRRGPPVAVIRVPRWPRQEEMCRRKPRGVKPRGTLRGGPERSAEDPQSKPQGRLWRGPERSANDPQLLHKNIKQAKAKGGRTPKQTKERPAIITVDESGEVRNWGPLSKANASRAGSYWEDMDRKIQALLEKDNTRRAVQVEKKDRRGDRVVLVPRKGPTAPAKTRRRRPPNP